MASFYIVDVFAEKKFAGNQLAVIRGAQDLSEDEMLSIAREINFAETTFIMSDTMRDGGYDIRIFTPAEEVPFAGHPTLGTAYVIRDAIIQSPVSNVTLNLKGGQVPVSFSGESNGIVWLKSPPPIFTGVFDPSFFGQMLSLDEGEIDVRFPIEEVSTGLPVIIVPLKSLSAVRKCNVNLPMYYELIQKTAAKSILVFAPETYEAEHDMNTRCFGDYYGMPEDPATGSANTCFAAYLVKHRYFDSKQIRITVEQGYEIKRPSVLYLDAEITNGDYRIFVGGKVVPIAKGEWLG